MKNKELIDYLLQLDPEAKVWVYSEDWSFCTKYTDYLKPDKPYGLYNDYNHTETHGIILPIALKQLDEFGN